MTSSHFNGAIFIVGFGRSGTTLLRTILSRHPRIAITPETHFMKRAEAEGGPHGEPANFEAFWRRLTGWVRFRDLGIDPAECRKRIEQSGDHSFRSVFNAMLGTYGKRLDKPRVGEKTPSHSRYLDDLLKWYPDARVLVIRRDPRAAIASFLRTPWVREKIFRPSLGRGLLTGQSVNEVADLAAEWEHLYSHEFPRWSDDPRFHFTSYEDLVCKPEEEVRRICNFLEEEFSPQMLQTGDEQNVPTSSGEMKDQDLEGWRRKHESLSMQPVSRASVEKWRDQLTRSEVALIEGRCAHAMKKGGYRPETQQPRRWLTSACCGLAVKAAKLEKQARNRIHLPRTGASLGWIALAPACI
jgi:hypothetical protein